MSRTESTSSPGSWDAGPAFSLVWAAFHEWVGIARDVRDAPGLAAKWGYVARPPGWSHDDSRDTSETIRARWAQAHPGDGPVARG